MTSALDATSLILVGGDDSLAVAASEAVELTASPCHLERIEPADLAARVDVGGVGLLLLHAPATTPVSALSPLLKTATAISAPVVIVSETDAADRLLALWRLGVAGVLPRPLNVSRLATLIDFLTLPARIAAPQTAADGGKDRAEMPVFSNESPVMDHLLGQVRRVAPLETTILLSGETGSGKTYLARLIHAFSPHRAGPFLTVNCAALAPTLIESEMFGHVRGAFTGAERDHVGKFAQAGSGTLLLDDIESMPLDIQAKLLRAVDERTFEPVGSDRPHKFRARLIVASNRDLQREVEAGRFRNDLFYRLNVINLQVPPLRERPDETRALAVRFAAEFAAQIGRQVEGFTRAALDSLTAYAWPGNIRELHNVIERAVALAGGAVIDVSDLPPEIVGSIGPPAKGHSPAQPNQLAEVRATAELNHLQSALARNKNNRTSTARELGISRAALYKKLHKFSLI